MLLTNLKLLDDNKIEKQRKETCESCEFFTKLKICGKCGCVMPLKWKFKYATCPLDKWIEIKEDV